jgi:hypothetical protein
MTLATHEFIRRFLIHILPKVFHRVRHYGLLAGGTRDKNLAQVRALLEVESIDAEDIETFDAGCRPRCTRILRIDTS